MKRPVLSLLLFLPQFLPAMSGGCDSLFLKNGQRMAVELRWSNQILLGYRECGATTAELAFVEKSEVANVVSADPHWMEEALPKLSERSKMVVLRGLVSGLLIVVSTIGFLNGSVSIALGLVTLLAVALLLWALASGHKLLRETQGMPRSQFVRRIRRRARRGMWLVLLFPVWFAVLIGLYALALSEE